MKQSTVVALLTLIWGAGLGLAQENDAKSPEQEKAAERRESSPDLDAIRAGSEAFVVAFNKADAKAVAALWADDGQYSDETGRIFAGRKAIDFAGRTIQ